MTARDRAAEVLEHLKQNLPQWEQTAEDIRNAAATPTDDLSMLAELRDRGALD